MTFEGVKINKPAKRFIFGCRMMALGSRAEFIEVVNKNSFNTHQEAWVYMISNKHWNNGGHPHSGILELTDKELDILNNVM